MARTKRRTNYTPRWVLREWLPFGGYYLLEGQDKKLKLVWYHKQHSNWWNVTPKKVFRKLEQKHYRMLCKTEIANLKKSEDYEVLMLAKHPYPYWD